MKKIILASALGLAALITASAVRAATDPPKAWQDVRALVVRFNDAQNSHNLDVVSALLLNSPSFVWEAGPLIEAGHDATVATLAQVYSGEWRVRPDYGSLNIQFLGPDSAAITDPTEFKTASPTGDVVNTEAVVRERAVRTPDGWRLASVEMAPAPAAMLP